MKASNTLWKTAPRSFFSNYESVSRDARETTLYTDEEPPGRHVKGDEDSCFKTEVLVVNADCLEEAIRLKNKGFNPAVLNMASPKRPGEWKNYF